MEITEVRVKLMGDNDDRLQAFCSITIDSEFVVRDLKIIDGPRGLFVAMPSRKLMAKCDSCYAKNEVRARYCSGCGVRLKENRHPDERPRLFADIAHPINARCREKIQAAVLTALAEERIKAQQPGYVCTYDEFDDVDMS
ncbi:MAG: SpoVG family protein [Planctomycetaceae bacterium]